jgi:hypothetical protein
MEEPLRSWVIIYAIGAVGGFSGTFLPTGMDLGFPKAIDDLIGDHKWIRAIFHWARATFFGGIASLGSWASFTAGVPATTPVSINLLTALAAFIAGLSGISVVSAWISSYVKDRTVKDLTTDNTNLYRQLYELKKLEKGANQEPAGES